MNYEESFLSTCDAEGKAPGWAIQEIFNEHGSDFAEYCAESGYNWDDGETILHWLGY